MKHDDDQLREIRETLLMTRLDGDTEVVGERDGEHQSRLTAQGNAKAENLIADKAFPFLVLIQAKKDVPGNEGSKVRELADKLVEKMPLNIQLRVKENFQSLWDIYGDMSVQEYIEAYKEASSE